MFGMDLSPKRSSESATEMVQVVLPNDANPLGFILGGTVMHLIDIAGAISCHRHTRSLLVTAAVDDLQFLHPIKVGDLIRQGGQLARPYYWGPFQLFTVAP